jgi:hypothetical protein
MIDLPDTPAPNGATPALIDFGGVARPALGGKLLQIVRAGSRFRINVSYPPLPSKREGRVFISRLLRGKSEGVRLEYPLLHENQGVSGNPVIDGSGQAGIAINMRGLQPHYTAKEGFWFSIQDAGGQHYLHNVAGNYSANAAGLLTLECYPPLRTSFANGAKVNFEKPMIEGLIIGDEIAWEMSLDRNLGITFVIEEAA